MTEAESLHEAFDAHRQSLWALAYRMLGTATDAEDAVQDAFIVAVERPPADRSRPWRPWLVRVLVNRCKDRLRARRRRGYAGPWLPSPLDTSDSARWSLSPLFPSLPSPDARYEQLESVTLAFLVALEALTPQQRAVLLLRDVCDCTTEETAAQLALSQANVKVTLHRARRALAAYDDARVLPDASLRQDTLAVLARFATALASGDLETLKACIADDVEVRADGGGTTRAASRIFGGAHTVAKLYLGLSARAGVGSIAVEERNGLPALVMEMPDAAGKWPRRAVITLLPDRSGKVWRIWSVTAPPKLRATPPA